MNASIDQTAILEYLSGLNPQNAFEVAKVSSEVKSFAQAIIELTERVNAPRKVKLWQEEIAQLKNIVEQLMQDIEQARAVDNEHQDLTKQRESLLAQKALIGDLSGQKEEILQLRSFISQYDIASLQKDLEQQQADATSDMVLLKEWIAAARDFFDKMQGDFTNEAQELFSRLERNREQIDVALKDVQTKVSLEQVELSKLVRVYDDNINEAVNSYNSVAEHLNGIKAKLLEIREKHGKNVIAYETHFAQNKAIWGELGKRHQLDTQIDALVGEIEKNLEQFDQDIKSLVEKVDHLIIF